MATKDGSGLFDDWPPWAKLTMSLAAMTLLGGTWVGVPLLMAWHLVGQGRDGDYHSMMSVLIAMTTATIAGIFLFMTLRIDRGTRLRAERVAKKAVKKKEKELDSKIESTVESIQSKAKETVQKFLKEIFGEETAPENIRKEVEARLTEEVLQRHVEAVLMIDANAQIVGEYAKQRAGELDPETIGRLAKLMDETFKAWRSFIKAKRQRHRKDSLKAFFSGFRRSSRDEQHS